MIQIRKSGDRGHFDHGWLDTYHTFSFGGYRDERHMGFRSLRVINEDRVQPGKGFGEHGHRDMEIVTYVLEGRLEHRDSLGNGSVLEAGELQRMTAGSGIRHSEFNPSDTEPVHLYQIWLLPDRHGPEPSYEERTFPANEKHGRLRLVASPDGRDDSMIIHQNAHVYLAALDAGASITHRLADGRHAWVQLVRGELQVDGERLQAGDGLAVSDESELAITANQPAELILFDLD